MPDPLPVTSDDAVGAALGLYLHWATDELPPGVTVAEDPAWEAAVAVLEQDPEFAVRRELLEGIDLHVVVRETDEATLTAHPEDGPTTAVVLELPVSDHRDADGVALPLPDRTELHLEAVITLVVETQAALGLEE